MEKRDNLDLPDLVRDTRLEAEIRGLVTVHTWPWQRQKREVWKRDPEPIGSGSYGVVWLEREVDRQLQPLGTQVRAVKQIRATKPANLVRECFRELEAVAKFSQAKYADHFVVSSGWYEGAGSLYLAMEFCSSGDLKAYVMGVGALPETEAKVVTRQMLMALAHMHGEKFAHRDLKPAVGVPPLTWDLLKYQSSSQLLTWPTQNVLISSHPPNPWVVKLSDFGLTKRCVSEDSSTAKGTAAFSPPELFGKDNRRCDPIAADIWSAGESSHYLLTMKPAFGDLSTRVQYASNSEDFPSSMLVRSGVSAVAQQFIETLMHSNPESRPSAEYALALPWLAIEDDETLPLPSAYDEPKDLHHFADEPEASAEWSTGPATHGTCDDEGPPSKPPLKDKQGVKTTFRARQLRRTKRNARRYSKVFKVKHEEWDYYHAIILDMWSRQGLSASAIASIMENEHGLRSTLVDATTRSYNTTQTPTMFGAELTYVNFHSLSSPDDKPSNAFEMKSTPNNEKKRSSSSTTSSGATTPTSESSAMMHMPSSSEEVRWRGKGKASEEGVLVGCRWQW
ncbi:protein kinase domain-containing protein [Sarocladium implicatum]|nr:protein kinase domain-containing protein [Sarocladium implicatum]